jgi:hypothetical protein
LELPRVPLLQLMVMVHHQDRSLGQSSSLGLELPRVPLLQLMVMVHCWLHASLHGIPLRPVTGTGMPCFFILLNLVFE